MTQAEPKPRHSLRKLTFVAFGIDVASTAGWWWIMLAIGYAQDHYDLAALYWPVVSIPIAFIVTIIGISFTVVAGKGRGGNRIIGIIGGLLLLTPLAYFAFTIFVYG